ncbi:MAG: hypothetical protein AAGA83_10515 [Cyanobacteria bacterium P01_F01_bin.116]
MCIVCGLGYSALLASAIATPELEKPFSIDDTLHILRPLQELAVKL